MTYLGQVVIAADQMLNALTGGWADETLSSRSFRLWNKGHPVGKVMMHTIDFIFFWEENHCYAAFLSEREGRHSPPEFRNK